MTRLVRFRSLVMAAALCASASACRKSEEGRDRMDRAGEKTREGARDVEEGAKDVGERAHEKTSELGERARGDTEEPRGDVGTRDTVGREPTAGTEPGTAPDRSDESAAKQPATQDTAAFEHAKQIRVATLRGQHAVAASQPMLINAISQGLQMSEEDRAPIAEKVKTFQGRLDDANNAIQALAAATPDDWNKRTEDAAQAMKHAEAARDDAWRSLHDAERAQGRTSMRNTQENPPSNVE